VTNYVLIALGLERMQPRAFAIAVSFNVIANVLFIRAYSYVAASVTTILSEVVLLLVFDYYLRKRMPGLEWRRLVVRPFLVTAIMVALMALGYQMLGVGTAVIGIVAYPIGLWAFRVIGEDEKQILRAVLPNAVTRRLKFLG